MTYDNIDGRRLTVGDIPGGEIRSIMTADGSGGPRAPGRGGAGLT